MHSIESKQLVSLENVNHGASSGIQSLPEDALLLIFSESGCIGLGKLMQVSKDYLEMTRQPTLWKATLLKELPNLIDDYPCLNNVPADKVVWKKVYLDESPSNADLKRWEGPHVIRVAFMYKIRTNNGLIETRILQKRVNLDLNSNELNLKIFKRIALDQLQLSYNPRQIDILLCGQAIPEKNNLPLKEIRISAPCSFPEFMDFANNEKVSVFINKKREALLPEEILPKEWEVPNGKTAITLEDLPAKKKKKPIRENCAMM